jgi:hypothetical protein
LEFGILSRAVSLEALDSCQELSLVSELKQKKLEYSQFFVSPFLQDEASELQFISLLNKVAAWPEVIFTISFVVWLFPWLRIRIHMFLGLLEPAPDTSIIKQK